MEQHTQPKRCAECDQDLWLQSKHYFEEADGAVTRLCLPCGRKRERRESRRGVS